MLFLWLFRVCRGRREDSLLWWLLALLLWLLLLLLLLLLRLLALLLHLRDPAFEGVVVLVQVSDGFLLGLDGHPSLSAHKVHIVLFELLLQISLSSL